MLNEAVLKRCLSELEAIMDMPEPKREPSNIAKVEAVDGVTISDRKRGGVYRVTYKDGSARDVLVDGDPIDAKLEPYENAHFLKPDYAKDKSADVRQFTVAGTEGMISEDVMNAIKHYQKECDEYAAAAFLNQSCG
jgi:hypothetical protein